MNMFVTKNYEKRRTRDQETIYNIDCRFTHSILGCLKLSVNYATMQEIVGAACYACAQLGGTC